MTSVPIIGLCRSRLDRRPANSAFLAGLGRIDSALAGLLALAQSRATESGGAPRGGVRDGGPCVAWGDRDRRIAWFRRKRAEPGCWRRKGGDSNPRGGGCPPAGFQDQCIQPLCHPSGERPASV